MNKLEILLTARNATGAAFKSVGKELGDLQSRAAGLGAALTRIAPALAGAFSVTVIGSFVKRTIDGIDALNDLSDATGSSIENLSALEDIAVRTGTSIETVGAAVVKMNQALGNSKPGSDVAKALNAIGLEAKAHKQLDPAEALRQIAVALAKFADDGNKARLVQELFGKSVREVAPLLKDLATQTKLVGTVTTEQAKAAEAFNIQLFNLQKNATDAARALSGPLITSLNDFWALMRRLNANKGGFLGGVADQFGADWARARLQAVTEELQRLTPAADRARRILENQPDSIRAKATLAEFEQLKRAAEQYRSDIDALLYSGGKRRPANEGGGRVVAPSIGDISFGESGSKKDKKDYPTAIKDPLQQMKQDFLASEKSAYAIAEDMGLMSIHATAILDPLEQMKQDFLASEKSAYEIVPALEEVSEYAKKAQENIQDAFGDTLLAAMNGSFDSIGDLWSAMIKRMIAEAASAQLSKYLFGAKGSGGGALDQLGEFFGFMFNGFSPAPRAAGGPISPGRAYLVGERGPEIVVPRAAGTVLPNGTGAMAAAPTYVVNVQGDASENTIRLIRGAMAQFEARQMMRSA